MKRLLRYLDNYKKESVLAPLFKMLEASFELFVPLVVAQIVDVGIKNQDTGYILKMGGLLLLLAVIGLTCSITAQFFAAKAAVGFATGLRNPYDQRHQPGPVRRKLNASSPFAFPIHRVWCHDHGLYGKCEGSYGFCCGNSGSFYYCIRHYGNQYAAL